MTTTKGSGQGSGGKGLLITATTSAAAQTLHTAVTGTGSTQLFRYQLVNNDLNDSVVVTLRFEPSDASAAVEIQETIPAQSAVFTPIPDTLGLPLNDTIVVKVYASVASQVTAYAEVTTQTANQNGATQILQTGEITLVQNDNAFRMNGVASSSTEADHEIILPVAGTVKNLRARCISTIQNGATTTVTVRRNGVGTALSLQFTAADTTTLKTESDQTAFAAGDRITILAATDNVGAPSATMVAAVEFVPS